VLDPLTNFTTRALVRTHYSLALFDHIQRINFVFTEKGGRGDILLSETDILLRMGIAPGGGGGGRGRSITSPPTYAVNTLSIDPYLARTYHMA